MSTKTIGLSSAQGRYRLECCRGIGLSDTNGCWYLCFFSDRSRDRLERIIKRDCQCTCVGTKSLISLKYYLRSECDADKRSLKQTRHYTDQSIGRRHSRQINNQQPCNRLRVRRAIGRVTKKYSKQRLSGETLTIISLCTIALYTRTLG